MEEFLDSSGVGLEEQWQERLEEYVVNDYLISVGYCTKEEVEKSSPYVRYVYFPTDQEFDEYLKNGKTKREIKE